MEETYKSLISREDMTKELLTHYLLVAGERIRHKRDFERSKAKGKLKSDKFTSTTPREQPEDDYDQNTTTPISSWNCLHYSPLDSLYSWFFGGHDDEKKRKHSKKE